MATEDRLLELCDAIVAQLDDGDWTVGGVEPTYEWKDDLYGLLSDSTILAPTVWVVDLAERHEPAFASSSGQAGMPVVDFEVAIVVQKKFGKDIEDADDRETACRNLSEFVSQISRFLRRQSLACGDGQNAVTCYRIERAAARDFKAYHENGLYRAEIVTHWRGLDEEDGE